MTLKEAIDILEKHNKWRRGDDEIEMTCPKDLGIAIDMIVRWYNCSEKQVNHVNRNKNNS